MTVAEALKKAQTAKEIELCGTYPMAARVLAEEVKRLNELITLCLPAVEWAKSSEKILNEKQQPFHELAEKIAKEFTGH